MNEIVRLLKYAWPYRRKVYASIVFAWLVALFWGLNLSMTYLVVKVFLDGQSIHEFVDSEIADSEARIKKATAELRRIGELTRPADEATETSDNAKIEHELVDLEIADSDARIEKATAELGRVRELSDPAAEATEMSDDAKIELQASRSKYQGRLSKHSSRLVLLKWLQTNAVPWLPSDHFNTYALILGVLLFATILKGLCIFVQEILIGSVVELTAMRVRKECFRKSLDLDFQSLSLFGTANLMSRFTFDMAQLSQALRLLGGKVIREPLKAVMCIVVALYWSWQLTLLSLVFAPLAAIVFYRIGQKLKQASRRLMENMSRIYKTLEETFDTAKLVIAFNGARRQRQRFHGENKQYYRTAMKIARIDALTSPTTETLGLFAASLALLPGAYLVLRDTTSIWGITLASEPMTLAALASLYAALAGIIDPARKLSTTYGKVRRGMVAAERVFSLMDRQSLVKEPSEPKSLPAHTESIEFNKIVFTYASHDDEIAARPTVLEDVTLKVDAREVIVVVGENGSGKSTLVNMLPRYYDPDSGSILVDGVNIRDVRARDVRAQIGVVTQETLLFDETIYENIRYGRPGATSAEVLEAASRAHVTQFVDALPEGFETLVGEKGGRLSGGQRQRVALARAILRNPSILILDEATSAIDAQSEQLIHEALRGFVKGRTTFIITHSVSPSILELVSRVVVMDQGRLIAAGTHEEVLSVCPTYERLYTAQIGQRAGGRTRATDSAKATPTSSVAESRPNVAPNPPADNLPTPRADEDEPIDDSPRIIPLRTPQPDSPPSNDAVG